MAGVLPNQVVTPPVRSARPATDSEGDDPYNGSVFSKWFNKTLLDNDIRGPALLELATSLGVVEQTISKWRNGQTVPKRSNLLGLADALGVQPAWLRDLAELQGGPVPESVIIHKPDRLEAVEIELRLLRSAVEVLTAQLERTFRNQVTAAQRATEVVAGGRARSEPTPSKSSPPVRRAGT
jgi:transcriptional regulator with XRE-family HTH domain